MRLFLTAAPAGSKVSLDCNVATSLTVVFVLMVVVDALWVATQSSSE